MLNLKTNSKQKVTNVLFWVIGITVGAVNVLAQIPRRAPSTEASAEPDYPQEDNMMYYIVLFLLMIGLIGAIGWWWKKKKAEKESTEKALKKKLAEGETDGDALDFNKEMEWFKNAARKKRESNSETKTIKKDPSIRREKRERKLAADRRAFERLPIVKIKGLTPTSPVEQLPLSDDEGLLSAIEQTHDEFEEDPEVRGLAVRILSKFRNRNAVEALAEVAQYDVSAHIRSEAVNALAEFDHESVFEVLLIACADPTREVRAAAAKALFRLNFDRAESWARLAQTNDQFRTVRAARAAIESELVERSIVRLVHEDSHYAYEAFALVALLIKAGETKEIFDVIENQSDKDVKYAILHCLKVMKNPDTLPALYNYVERNSLPEDLSNAVNDVIRSFDTVSV